VTKIKYERTLNRRGLPWCTACVVTGVVLSVAGGALKRMPIEPTAHGAQHDTDETFSHAFDAVRTYKYDCSIHSRMTGQVVVR